VNRYKIPFIVADNTYSLEFMMFERRATEVIGKSAETLHKYNDPVAVPSLQFQATFHNGFAVPSNISQWIGHKFTFCCKCFIQEEYRDKRSII
jgi:replication factor A1